MSEIEIVGWKLSWRVGLSNPARVAMDEGAEPGDEDVSAGGRTKGEERTTTTWQ